MRAAVFPVAAWTMRRRPGLAERTRRMAADIVSAATRSLSFASADVDPALVHYVDAMIAGTPVDVIAEFYPALAGHGPHRVRWSRCGRCRRWCSPATRTS